MMVVGASGTGRTTFINTLCNANVMEHKEVDDPTNAHLEDEISIQPVTVDLEEDGTRISLTIVDCPSFGDSINNEMQ